MSFKDITAYFDKQGPKSLLGLCRKFPEDTYISDVRAVLGAGFTFNQDWIDMEPPVHVSQYWKGCILTRFDGFQEPAENFLERLKNPTDKIISVNKENYIIEKWFLPSKVENENKEEQKGWTVTSKSSGKYWNIEAKLFLNEDDLYSVINLLEAFIPSFTFSDNNKNKESVSLQADAHRAGDCWVGLIASYDNKRIPFIPISADIGCGMCMVPMVKEEKPRDLIQLNSSICPSEIEKLKASVCYKARKVLARGKVAENGNVNSFFIKEALSFINTDTLENHENDELKKWIDGFIQLFNDLDIKVPKVNKVIFEDFTEEQNSTLFYVMGFALTLGSSGNHFLEMNEDENKNLYLVVHSGSRGLGALVYRKISCICHVLYGNNAVASNEMATLYNKAFSLLNKFAIINRISCAIAMLKELGFCYNGKKMRDYLITKNILFKGVQPHDVSNLLRGVTHNGVKCFVNYQDKKKIFIMGKGAISVSSKSSCGIVALRAGEGVYVMNFINPSSKWEEIDLGSLKCIDDYEIIYDISQTDVLFMGHGAGRSGSATNTWKNSEYDSMIQYFLDRNMWFNISPNVLGDNPISAYKPVEEVIKYLPLEMAYSYSTLKTLVNHKEGIEVRPKPRQKFADFIHENWEKLPSNVKIMCDLILASNEIEKLRGKHWVKNAIEEQDNIYSNLIGAK